VFHKDCSGESGDGHVAGHMLSAMHLPM